MNMYDQAYIDYLVHFHCDRDYFECHEVLEEHWKKDSAGERKNYWVGFIQIAVGLYHHRRRNFKGALRMISNAIHLLESEQEIVLKLGIHYDELMQLLRNRKHEILHNIDYHSMNLPIIDSHLRSLCEQECHTHNITWGVESDLKNEYLIHKHMKRDRTDVILERAKQLRMKKYK